MKKVFIYGIMAMFALFGTSCSCNRESQPVFSGYNYDEVVCADYDFVASQYDDFKFYEVDVIFDTTLNIEGNRYIYGIATVFQAKDTCVIIEHENGNEPVVTKVNDFWAGCSEMDVNPPVTFDSCMLIIDTLRSNLNTRYMTYRRILAKPFPKNGQYIFGCGLIGVDGVTGELVKFDANFQESGFKSDK